MGLDQGAPSGLGPGVKWVKVFSKANLDEYGEEPTQKAALVTREEGEEDRCLLLSSISNCKEVEHYERIVARRVKAGLPRLVASWMKGLDGGRGILAESNTNFNERTFHSMASDFFGLSWGFYHSITTDV